ncbi:MAG: ABC-F family ATP-binding cassette domain-containing protein [Chloroflexota bacterium]
MSLLSVRNLGLEYGARDVFSAVSAELPVGGKVGLVGPNGVGKTSLLRIVAGISKPTTGTVHFRRGTTLGYLRQEAVEAFIGRHHTVYDEMLTVFAHLQSDAASLRDLEVRMGAGESTPDLLERYGTLQEAYERGGGYDYEVRIKTVLHGLGFDEAGWAITVDHLSGGQKTRALLARLLLERPALLILDEPTNHLDVQAVEWLEHTLRTWDGALLVASHDRYFLDTVADRIWEMTPTHIEDYRGNYSAYVHQREERWERNSLVYEREIERLQHELETVRRYFAWRKFEEAHGRLKRLGRELRAIEEFGLLAVQGKSWGEIAESTGLRSRSEMHLEEAHQRIKALRPPASPPKLHVQLHGAARSGQIILRTEGLKVGYGTEALFAADDIHLERLDRVALIGPNGSGKTTFLRTLLGTLPPIAGHVHLGASLKIGYFAQTHDGLDGTRSVLDELLAHRNLPLPEARGYLAQYLFRGDDVHKLVSALSGGERGRLALAILTLEGVNLLLLDEPTNHLDIAAQEVLQEGLERFDGTLLLVSHDRYLVEQLATRVWELRDGRLHTFKGTYKEFLARGEGEELTPPSSTTDSRTRRRNVSSEKEERRRQQHLTTVEGKIAEAEETLARYTRQMEEESAAGDYGELTELAKSYSVAEKELQLFMAEWEGLAVNGQS